MLSKKLAVIKEENNGLLPYNSALGGYSLTYITDNNNVVCGDCANLLAHCEVTVVSEIFIHWEGNATYCEECNKEIKPEYGNPEEE